MNQYLSWAEQPLRPLILCEILGMLTLKEYFLKFSDVIVGRLSSINWEQLKKWFFPFSQKKSFTKCWNEAFGWWFFWTCCQGWGIWWSWTRRWTQGSGDWNWSCRETRCLVDKKNYIWKERIRKMLLCNQSSTEKNSCCHTWTQLTNSTELKCSWSVGVH